MKKKTPAIAKGSGETDRTRRLSSFSFYFWNKAFWWWNKGFFDAFTAGNMEKSSMSQSHAHENSPRVSRVFTDRIAADGEQVAQVLEPNRSAENIRYPDPHSPNAVDDRLSAAPISNAEFQMARRTDAGPSEAMDRMSGITKTYSVWLWIIGGGTLLLVAALVATM